MDSPHFVCIFCYDHLEPNAEVASKHMLDHFMRPYYCVDCDLKQTECLVNHQEEKVPCNDADTLHILKWIKKFVKKQIDGTMKQQLPEKLCPLCNIFEIHGRYSKDSLSLEEMTRIVRADRLEHFHGQLTEPTEIHVKEDKIRNHILRHLGYVSFTCSCVAPSTGVMLKHMFRHIYSEHDHGDIADDIEAFRQLQPKHITKLESFLMTYLRIHHNRKWSPESDLFVKNILDEDPSLITRLSFYTPIVTTNRIPNASNSSGLESPQDIQVIKLEKVVIANTLVIDKAKASNRAAKREEASAISDVTSSHVPCPPPLKLLRKPTNQISTDLSRNPSEATATLPNIDASRQDQPTPKKIEKSTCEPSQNNKSRSRKDRHVYKVDEQENKKVPAITDNGPPKNCDSSSILKKATEVSTKSAKILPVAGVNSKPKYASLFSKYDLQTCSLELPNLVVSRNSRYFCITNGHGIPIKEDACKITYYCMFCCRDYNSRSFTEKCLKEHLKYSPFRCVFCEEVFSHKSAVVEHVEKRHPGRHDFICFVDETSEVIETWLQDYLNYQEMNFPMQPTTSNLCPMCYCLDGKGSKWSVTHAYDHIQYKPYSCKMCKEENVIYSCCAVDSRALNHLDMVHDLKVPTPALKKYFEEDRKIVYIELKLKEYSAKLMKELQSRAKEENKLPIKVSSSPRKKRRKNDYDALTRKQQKRSKAVRTSGASGKNLSALTELSFESKVSSLPLVVKPVEPSLRIFCLFCPKICSTAKEAFLHYCEELDYQIVECYDNDESFCSGFSSYEKLFIHQEKSGHVFRETNKKDRRRPINSSLTFCPDCPICRKMFPNLESGEELSGEGLRYHMYDHLLYSKKKCKHCIFMPSNPEEMRFHLETYGSGSELDSRLLKFNWEDCSIAKLDEYIESFVNQDHITDFMFEKLLMMEGQAAPDAENIDTLPDCGFV
ncbi:hypothetical protein HDE_06365 [Halotydeus destructor]|nr:hypothetical protein HDE_06365 [Halotydeus destructor]